MSSTMEEFFLIDACVRRDLSLSRYLHSVRTAYTTAEICRKFETPGARTAYGEAPAADASSEASYEEALVAGIAHDLARELEADELIRLARKDVFPPAKEELEKPSLLHGKAAAVLLPELFGERREHILEAVRWHTCGHPEMGDLGKMLYIADFIEPGRKHVDEHYYERIMAGNDLDEMVVTILEDEFEFLRRKGRRIVESSLLLYDALTKSRVGARHSG